MNITLDFTQNQSVKNLTEKQPLAVMSANLAKTLLKMYAEKLSTRSTNDIISDHMHELSSAKNLDHAIQLSIDFVAKRELIQNILNEKWDAYEVKSEAKEQKIPPQFADQ